MNPPDEHQMEIPFGADSSERGFAQWRQQRQEGRKQLAREMGLPLDHRVEVWLRNGMCLRGMLRLAEELLWLPQSKPLALTLLVDRVSFTPAEIESCVRMD